VKKPREISIIGDKAFVPLTQGFCAVIDADDLGKVEGYCWHVFIDKSNIYARRTAHLDDGTKKTIQMHREIFGCDEVPVVDHRDGNGLNNIRANLRACTQVQNARNLKKYKSNSTGFRGVQPHGKGKFRAQIRNNKKLVHLGIFETAELASQAYETAKSDLHGEFVRPNFQAKPVGGLFR
tara:strand:- start:872 stop:1411 length:540 start_codon:yes stop_codon:yes gene_type:complete